VSAAPNLKIVKHPPQDAGAPVEAGPELADIALIATLFVLNLVPVIGELAGMGRWSPGIVGFAVAAAVLAGRELWSELRARARARHPT
jgi:hypothetical protein